MLQHNIIQQGTIGKVDHPQNASSGPSFDIMTRKFIYMWNILALRK